MTEVGLDPERETVAAAGRRLAATGLVTGVRGLRHAGVADGVLAALEDRRAALLSGHGAVVHAAGVGEAVELTALLEWACTVFWRTAAIGTPRTLGEAEVAQAREGLDWTRRVSS